MDVAHINPESLLTPRGYSHAVAVSGPHTTIYFGGQPPVDAAGQTVGAGDLRAQTEQALSNIETLLAASGARFADVVKLNVHLVQGQDLLAGFAAFQSRWAGAASFPAVTVFFVAGLAEPDWLVEIDGIAVVPAER